MKTSFLLAAAVLLASLPMTAKATIITNVTNGPGAIGQTSLGSSSLNHVLSGNGLTPGNSVNTITLNATALSGYQNGTAFTWTFGYTDIDFVSETNGNTKYLVTVNLTNSRLHPIAPVRFTLSPFVQAGPPVGDHSFVSASSPTPTSTYNTVNFNGINAGTPTLQFGGLQGGGGELYNGQTGTFTFHIDLKDYVGGSSGSFILSMVANPEPASLVLGGVAIALAGGYRAARRRRKKLDETEESVAV